MSSPTSGVGERFEEALSELGPPATFVVAVSGGMDSCVLLHLARFAAAGMGHGWVAAHFDHRMRESSADDARFVAGLCRAWDVPFRAGAATAPLRSEAEARKARYAFLERVRAEVGAARVLTAHHADDQAETVLFRLLRGTGTKGLAGIPVRRGPTIARPLLDVWREELEQYAEAVRLDWREDPTNRDPSFARNAIRNRILPDAERLVAPAARRALVRLADVSGDEEAAWESALPHVLRSLGLEEVTGGLSVPRGAILDLHPALRARVVRALASRLGSALDRNATRRVLAFAESGSSGRAIELGGALTAAVELDRFVVARAAPRGEELPLAIPDSGPGRGEAVLAGSSVPVSWGSDEVAGHRFSEGFDPRQLAFPLVVRSRRPGDRIRLESGTKKVKKAMLERRIPPSERHCLPVLADATGRVLWIPGVARTDGLAGAGPGQGLRIGVGS